jgi:3-oxoacyl-[acyl-carrier-protein] synthase II
MTNLKRVVVTGIGAVSPGGKGLTSFWNTLSKGKSCVDKITLFETSDLPVQVAAEVKDLDFTTIIPANKLRAVHRVVPITLAATQEALEDSGLINRQDLFEDMDVIVGTAAHGLGYYEEQANEFFSKGYKGVSPHCCTGTFVGMISSEISMYYGFHGTSLVVSTGCTTAHDSIGYAYNRIRFGQSKVVISGSGESCVTRMVVSFFAKMGALTKDWNDDPKRASRPFDLKRSGFVIGEGAWIFTLEEMEHALDRGAKIYGEICGYANTSDAYHKTAPEPSGKHFARAMEKSLIEAQVEPSQVNYINPHGTATPLNDKTETLAIKRCFGDALARKIPISSFKSSLGHPQGASGACGLAGTLLAMKNNFIPPTINLDNPDPDCDLDYVPNVGRQASVDVALLNSIAYGSRNSTLVVRKFKK